MRDDRIRQLATVDVLARHHNKRVIFVFRSENAKAVYIFGKRVFASKSWNEPGWWQRYKTKRGNK